MLKITHASDLHFSEKYREEALKALRFILEISRAREVRAILFSGDFFDGPVQMGTMMNEVAGLLCMTPCPIYIIRGTPSHDQEGAVDFLAKIGVYNGQMINCHIFPASYSTPYGHLSFLPAPTKSFLAQDASGSPEEINQIMQQKLRGILADFGAKAADGPRPHILVSHITVAGAETSTHQILTGGDIQTSIADLSLVNADYIALGHIHKAQKLGDNIYYAGSPFHLNFGELEDKGFNIVTFDDESNLADVEFIKTDSRARQVIEAEIVEGKLKLSDVPQVGADIRVRIYGSQHQITDDFAPQAEGLCVGCNSLKVELIPTAENRVRAANLLTSKTLRSKLEEYGKVKTIDIPESAFQKAEELEGAI